MARSMKEVKANAENPPRVLLPSTIFARSLPTTRKREREQLCEIEKKAFSSHKRYRERPYLAAVYQLYRDWVQDKNPTGRAAQMAALCSKSLRSDAHPISVLLACSSPGTDQKMRSKWSLALRFAYAKYDVSASDLDNFMDAHDGMAACASEFAPLNKALKQKQALKKKQKKIVLKKKARLKRTKRPIPSKTASRQKEKHGTEPSDKSSW